MSRRRARSAALAGSTAPEFIPVSARIPYSYLACLLAAATAGLVVVVASVVITPLLCDAAASTDLGDCTFGGELWLGLACFLLALVPIALALHVGWTQVMAILGLALLVLRLDAFEQPWWWAFAAVVPAVAALLGADWERGSGLRIAQYILLGTLDVAAIIAVALWIAGS